METPHNPSSKRFTGPSPNSGPIDVSLNPGGISIHYLGGRHEGWTRPTDLLELEYRLRMAFAGSSFTPAEVDSKVQSLIDQARNEAKPLDQNRELTEPSG